MSAFPTRTAPSTNTGIATQCNPKTNARFPRPLRRDRDATRTEVMWDRARPIRGPVVREWFVGLGPQRWLGEAMAARLWFVPGTNKGVVPSEPAILAKWQNIGTGKWTGTLLINLDHDGRPTGTRTVGKCVGSALRFGPELPTGDRTAPLVIAPSLRSAALAGRILEEPRSVYVLPSLRAIARFPLLGNVSKLAVVLPKDEAWPAHDVARRYLNEVVPVEVITVFEEGAVR
jgi:hypothetical protein